MRSGLSVLTYPTDDRVFEQNVWEDSAMPERLVDVLNGAGNVLHTFPVVAEATDATSDEDYITNALKLAAHYPLIPGGDVKTFTARLHVARGGALAPYGDDRHILEGTMQGLENVLRVRRNFLLCRSNMRQHVPAAVRRWRHMRKTAIVLAVLATA